MEKKAHREMVKLGLNLGTLAAGTTPLTSTLHCLLVVEEPLDLAKRAGIQFVLLLVSCVAFDEPHNLSRLYSYLSKALPFSL